MLNLLTTLLGLTSPAPVKPVRAAGPVAVAGKPIHQPRPAFAPPSGPTIHCPDINALVMFAETSGVVTGFVSLTDASFARAVRTLPQRVGGRTNMAAGLNTAISLFANMPAGLLRKIVLLTDGHASCQKAAVEAAARRALEAHINIDTVGIGAASDYDGDLLRKVSATTHNGRFFHCGGIAALDRALGHGRSRSISHRGQATVFVVDCSGSMNAPYGKQTRIEAVRDAIQRIVRVKQKKWN